MNGLERLLDQQEKEKTYLVVSRHWHNPQIRITLNHQGIELKMPISELAVAIAQDLNLAPALDKATTRTTFGRHWNALVRKVFQEEIDSYLKVAVAASLKSAVEKIKEASAQVM